MHNKWKAAANKLNDLTKKYQNAKKLPESQIHQDILIRALKLLRETAPEAEALVRPQLGIMLPYTVRADESGDRENGAGRHYYSVCTSSLRRVAPICGYYKNGKDLFAKSARTMFEEDYTMALTMHNAGFVKQGAVYLARAVHMLSDMCCLPHATKMTYFSNKKCVHVSYEELARAMYPEFVPEQHICYETLRRFAMRSSFSTALNRNAERICSEVDEMLKSPENEIIARLYDTEQAVAALLYRFYRDTLVTPLRGHYAANGMACSFFADTPPLTVKVTELGVIFELNDMPVNFSYGSIFRIAHRRNGLFSVSPINERNGLVVSRRTQSLANFDPGDEQQLFNIV